MTLEQPSVHEFLGAVHRTVNGVRQTIVLGSGAAVIGVTGAPASEVRDLVRSLASALAAANPQLTGGSARSSVTLPQHSVLVYVLGADLAVALVGPSGWNLALASRLTEPLLVRFVDRYVPELSARGSVREPLALTATAPLQPKELGQKKSTAPAAFARTPLRPQRTPKHFVDRVVAQRSPLKRSPLRSTQPELIRDPVLLDRILVGLAGL